MIQEELAHQLPLCEGLNEKRLKICEPLYKTVPFRDTRLSFKDDALKL